MTIQTMTRKSLRGLDRAGGFLTRRRETRYLYLTAFFLPVLLMGFMWAVCGVTPFGSKMILAHDQWHQYYPFYLDLRERLREGNSLLHSWTTGMGTSYLPLFAYYLASPLNYLAVILPQGLVMLWYNIAVLIRLGLAGLFCAIFLSKTFQREELTVAAFSTAYAFCGFLMGYYWNAIWLDTVALLPLVALGTLELLRNRRFVLYVTTLALSVFCSYYIGLFTCIFVLLLFIGYHIVYWDDLAGFWTRLWRIALFTLIALGMTAVLTIPAFLGLQSTSSAVNKFPAANAMNIVQIPQQHHKTVMEELINQGDLQALFSFFGRKAPSYAEEHTFTPGWAGLRESFVSLKLGYFKSFLAGFRIPLSGLRDVLSNTGTLTEPTTMEGLPNIFCGFGTMILAVLYLFCKRIPRRERVFSVLLLLFFAASFLFRPLDYIWHGFHFPNMLPHRFSFLWSFVVIFMAFRAYTQLEHLSQWRLMAAVLPVVLLLWCVVAGSGSKLTVFTTAAVTLLGLAALLLYGFRLLPKQVLSLGICVCLLLEALGCGILGVHKIGVTDSSYYPTKKADAIPLVEKMLQREENTVDLWRAEVAMKQTLNDGTLLGYNGVSCFSSAANSRISAFLQSIGLAASVAGNRYVYQEADPFTNLLLGIKYIIDRNDRNVNPDYFRQVDSQGEVKLLENKSYLSLGFLVRDNALEYDASQNSGLPFDRLNRLFREMSGLEGELYVSTPLTEVKAVGSAQLSAKTSTSFQVSGDCDSENYVEATVVMPKDGLLCFYSKGSSVGDVVFFLNGEKQYSWSDSYGYNRCMGRFVQGDRISLRYQAKSGKNGSVSLGAALFQTELFDTAYQNFSANSMIPTQVSDTVIEGAVRVQEAGLLYLSIPNDNGWSLTVDGEKARITPVGNAMIAVHLETGLHAIRLEFETPGFSLGLKITIICLAAYMVLLILALLSRFTRPPIVKLPVQLADPRQTDQGPAPDAPPESAPMPPPPPPAVEAPAQARSGSGNTMPKLDMTQPWNTGVLPRDAVDELYGYGQELRKKEPDDLRRDGTLPSGSELRRDGTLPSASPEEETVKTYTPRRRQEFEDLRMSRDRLEQLLRGAGEKKE